MSDAVLAGLFVALCVDIFAWILIYRAVERRVQNQHPAHHPAVFGTATRRKNGMDRFFSVVMFLFQQDHGLMGDRRLVGLCLALKIATALLPLIFVSMMFGPFFLREK
ncbi:MAG TPA: hypothetical protein VIM61_13585 [Chthoniobacterales bacterium]